MRHRICLFDVTASHYRGPIFKLMSDVFDIDFYFGDMMPSIKLMNLNDLNRYRKIHIIKIGPMFWYKGMISIVAQPNYDTFIFDGDYRCLSTWIALILCKILGKRTYLWTHGFYGSEKGIKIVVKKAFIHLASGCLLYGNYARNLMVTRYRFPLNKLWVIHNSLDYELHKSIRKTLSPSDIYSNYFGNSHAVIIFIGRLTAVKKLEMIIEAQVRLKKRDVFVNVVFVGDGPMRESLKRLAIKYAVSDAVWFYGASYDERINAELIYNADICVSPGNIGLTALHSLSFGTPAFTHNDLERQMPEFEVIRKGETGDFFLNENVDSLVETIQQWLCSNNSREIVRKNCYNIIDSDWNPYFQINVLKKVIGDEY